VTVTFVAVGLIAPDAAGRGREAADAPALDTLDTLDALGALDTCWTGVGFVVHAVARARTPHHERACNTRT
jgi:hypothetical protein